MRRAYQLDNDKYEYEFKVVSIKMNVREIEKTLTSAKRSAEILTIVSNVCLLLLFLFPADAAEPSVRRGNQLQAAHGGDRR